MENNSLAKYYQQKQGSVAKKELAKVSISFQKTERKKQQYGLERLKVFLNMENKCWLSSRNKIYKAWENISL